MIISNFTEKDLQQLTQKVALKYFHKPFTDCAYFMNPHSKGVVGGFFSKCTNNIFIKSKFLKIYGFPVFIDLIKHELCHYFIWKSGNHIESHGHIFNNLLHKVGGLRYAPPLSKNKPVAIYFCIKCHQSYIFNHELDLNKHFCKRCHSKLKCIYINKSAKNYLIDLKKNQERKQQILKNATPKQRTFMKLFIKGF